jgi:RNA polymerase sigma-70 factor, ECF subfamily
MGRDVDVSTEDALVKRSIRGDERAFALLVDRYKAMLFSMSYRLLGDSGLAEDAAQESFIKAYAALSGFRGQSKFSSWLYRICYNTCISMLRRRKPSVELDEAMSVSIAGPADNFQREDARQAIEVELKGLPDGPRQLLTLYHLNDLSYEEIAKLVRKPMGTVKAEIHRGRQMLRERLVERVGWRGLQNVMWR